MNLTRKHPTAATSRRIATAAAVLLGAATCATAMTLRLEIPAHSIIAPPPIAAAAQQPNGPMRISGGVAAGQIISKVNPIYPPEAREKGIQGAVVLHAIINADGIVQELAVISGPEELRASAMEAVKQWVYKPYLLNGQPTEVDTTITVNFSLASPPQASNAAGQQPSTPAQASVHNTDGDVYNVGGSVRAPILVSAVDPVYSEAARKAKLSGNVIVALIVDPAGEPQNVRVARGLGNDLDKKAVEAVQQYRFKPATRNGEPVSANLKVAVNFQIF